MEQKSIRLGGRSYCEDRIKKRGTVAQFEEQDELLTSNDIELTPLSFNITASRYVKEPRYEIYSP